MNQKLKEEIMVWHNKGLTQYYIATKLRLPVGIVEKIIETELKEDFNSLFRGG